MNSATSNSTNAMSDTAKPKEHSIPSLSASDIQSVGASPTNVALESGLTATTSDSEKLKVAMAEIEKLREQLSEARATPSATGLRRRGGGTGGTESETKTEVAVETAKQVISGQQGVPIEIVVGLVVGVFVLTYLFF